MSLFFDTDGPQYVLGETSVDLLPTAVLVPGGPGQSHLHHKVTPPLPEGLVHVVHYDHRGTGQSDESTPDKWNLDTWSSDLAGLCDALDIRHPVVLGTSFGAIVALRFAQMYPDRPSKLILVSGVARFVREEMLDVFDRLGGAEARRIADEFYRDPSRDTAAEFQRVCSPLYTRTPADEERIRPMLGEPLNMTLIMHWARGEARTLDLRADLAAVRCPTLILAGLDDPAAPSSASREIADGIAGNLVTLKVFEHCGHNPLHDARAQALEVVESFLMS